MTNKNRILFKALALPVFILGVSCSDHRDLYVTSNAMLKINTDWSENTYYPDFSTLMVYEEQNSGLSKYIIEGNESADLNLNTGVYNFIIVNEIMSDEQNSGIDYLRYRGTGSFDTFEAYAAVNRQRSSTRTDGKDVVFNPDTLYSAVQSIYSFENSKGYFLKYQNGHNGFDTPADYVKDSLCVDIKRRVIKTEVNVTVKGFSFMKPGIDSSFDGYAGSVFLASGKRSDDVVVHEFEINDIIQTDAVNDIAVFTGGFSCFGPSDNWEDKEYILTMYVKMVNDVTGVTQIDVRDQIEAYMSEGKINTGCIRLNVEVEVDHLDITVPDIGVDGWGDETDIILPLN